jgi:hypothetical protein
VLNPGHHKGIACTVRIGCRQELGFQFGAVEQRKKGGQPQKTWVSAPCWGHGQAWRACRREYEGHFGAVEEEKRRAATKDMGKCPLLGAWTGLRDLHRLPIRGSRAGKKEKQPPKTWVSAPCWGHGQAWRACRREYEDHFGAFKQEKRGRPQGAWVGRPRSAGESRASNPGRSSKRRGGVTKDISVFDVTQRTMPPIRWSCQRWCDQDCQMW